MFRLILLLTITGLVGCTHVLPEQALNRVDRDTDFKAVKAAPEASGGKTLLLGGVIMGTKSEAEQSTIEISRWRLDRWGEPVDPDHGGGRFLVRTGEILDPDLFVAGRLITLVGRVKGQATSFLGINQRSYPIFELQEFYLWETPFRTMVRPGPNYFAPVYVGQNWTPGSNPYDPGYNPYPYTPFDLRPPRQ